MSGPTTVKALAAMKEGPGNFQKIDIERRAVSSIDVRLDIKYAGICHSDISQVYGEWGSKIFPMVPGHEIVGIVTEVGSEVTKFKVGDKVGIGCMVDSCLHCKQCIKSEEQYCQNGGVFTYNSAYKYDRKDGDFEKPTYGGYSTSMVVREEFVLRVPDNIDFAAAAPLLCAGITTYSPLISYGIRPHHKVGVAGLGGLGHMAVKFAKAFGAHVSVISRGTAKKEAAFELGANAYIDIKSEEDSKAAAGSLDFIIDTVGVDHEVNPYIDLLGIDGTLICVGVFPVARVSAASVIFGRKKVGGSLIGGIKETQEMLDFCGRNNITCDIELISIDQVQEAYDRCLKSDVKYRFVIDCSTL